MRPRAFDYARAATLDDAVRLALDGVDSHFYAGGTELLLAMKLRVISPERLIDLKRIPDFDHIAMADGVLSIGARATHAQIERDEIVRQVLPSLATLCSNVANVRVRGAGTIGGNICFADPHADPPVLLAALGATLHLTGPKGSREVAIDDFTIGEYETVRDPEELLTRICLRAPNGPVAYRRFRHGERPSVNCGLAWSMARDGLTIADCRLRVGALGPRPQALSMLERHLTGQLASEAREIVANKLTPALEELDVNEDRHGRADYKRHVAGTLLRRNVEDALEQLDEAA